MEEQRSQTLGKILCCLCGASITPNAAAMCAKCLQAEVDITSSIEKDCLIIQCGKCDKWLNKLDNWVPHELESVGLLNLCIKKVNGLNTPDTKIKDARWIWTEPHSKRLKICVDIEKDVLDDKVRVGQRVIVDFIIKNKQCLECIHGATDHNWGALVQIRQHTGNKRSLYHLESLLTKAGLHSLMSEIQVKKEGLDIYFRAKNMAEKVVTFITSIMPGRFKSSRKLVSRDLRSNTARYEHTIFVELVPISRDDLILLPKEYTGKEEVMIVTKVASYIRAINPLTMNMIEINATKYFSKPFLPLFSLKDAVEYIILDIEASQPPTSNHDSSKVNDSKDKKKGGSKNGNKSSVSEVSKDVDTNSANFQFAEAEVVRESDITENNDSSLIKTHLGHYLQAGDLSLGYDLRHSTRDEDIFSTLNYDLPDVILVKKIFPEGTQPKKKKKNHRVSKKTSSSVRFEENKTTSDQVDTSINIVESVDGEETVENQIVEDGDNEDDDDIYEDFSDDDEVDLSALIEVDGDNDDGNVPNDDEDDVVDGKDLEIDELDVGSP